MDEAGRVEEIGVPEAPFSIMKFDRLSLPLLKLQPDGREGDDIIPSVALALEFLSLPILNPLLIPKKLFSRSLL